MTTPTHIPKLCGADVELGNFLLRPREGTGTGRIASQALLREVSGHSRRDISSSWSWDPWGTSSQWCAEERWLHGDSSVSRVPHECDAHDPQDWGRKFLSSNGGCCYIDLDHFEICLPEVLSAWDHVAAWQAMLRIAQQALDAANAKRPADERIAVLVNSSDGHGHSYGAHVSVLVTQRAWDSLFHRKLQHLLWLASYQVSSLIFTGQGKVGAENGAPSAAYQISQRADFFETLAGPQTTNRRPLVNSRHEPLCGPSSNSVSSLGRLHCIFYDSTLCQVASLLKIGVLQIILTMLEAECVRPELAFDDPLAAVVGYSHDPSLRSRARLLSGRRVTAVEHQMLFLERARAFVEAGGCEGVVPRAPEILALWEGTLAALRARDWEGLTSKLDWVLKRALIRQAMERRPGLTWRSPEIKHLDHLYAALDPADGLHWACASAGAVERVVTDNHVAHLVCEPPSDTRAWTRAMLLRHAGEAVDDLDWDMIRFRTAGRGWTATHRTLHLPDPLAGKRPRIESALRDCETLDALLDALEAGRDELSCPLPAQAEPRSMKGEHDHEDASA